MTPETTTGQAPATTGQVPAATTATVTTPPTGQEPEAQTFDLAYVKQLRQEAAEARTQKQELGRQVRDLLPKAEKGSELEKALEKLQGDLENERLRADFADAAVRPEIGCSNPRVAFLIAHDIAAIGARGRIDWDAIKQAAPELFLKRAPDGRAGVATGSPPVTKIDMNSLIRRAAGRQP